MTEIVEVDPRVDDRWRALVAQRSGSLFHSPEWATVLSDAYGWSPRATVVVDAVGALVAGVPWCRVADAGGDRIVSLPFSDFCGPLGGHHDELFAELDRIGLPVQCRVVADPGDPTPRPITGTARWHGIRLDGDPSAAWDRLDGSARRAVRKARRERVTIEERVDAAFLPQFLRLHTVVRKGKYHLLPQPLAFFAALRDRFAPSGCWHPLVAVHGDQILAATVYVHAGDTLFYKFNASDPATLGARPNDLLLWEGIVLAIRLGCRVLDLGASDDDQPGLIRFKRGFGSDEREIRRLASGPPLPEAHARFRGVLTDLTARFTDETVPDAVTEAAGAALYRYFA